MCCWPFADVWLEDPPEKKKEEPKPVPMYYYPYAYPPAPKPADPAPTNGPTTYTYVPRYSQSQPAPAAPQPQVYPYYATYPYYQAVTYPSSAVQNPQPVHAAAPAQPQVYQYQPSYPNPYAAPPVSNPDNHPLWYGATRAEIEQGNIEIAQRFGAMSPQAMVPANPDPGQQYLCYDVDGTTTLRRKAEIEEDLQPGYWALAPNGGPYFQRVKPA